MHASAKNITFDDPFTTEKGDFLPELSVAFRTWGELNANRDNAVLVCHALTGNTDADVWFGGLFGEGKTIDPNRHFVICPNVLGSCYGTTGPTHINPETDEPYQADFPEVSVRDAARVHQKLLDTLGIQELELAIGGSLGGMQVLEFCILDDRPRAGICIGMGKAHRPWQIGISHTQRQAIFNDPNWNDGFYSEEKPPVSGLATARMIAMNSYRSPQDFDAKFGRKTQAENKLFQIESYLNYQGKKLTERFDAVSYVRLTQMMDSHNVARDRKSYRKALQDVKIPVLVAGIDSDWLYPVDEQKELADLLPQGNYVEIQSTHGHDAFLIEFDQMNTHFTSFINQTQKTPTT